MIVCEPLRGQVDQPDQPDIRRYFSVHFIHSIINEPFFSLEWTFGSRAKSEGKHLRSWLTLG